jgi:transcriptional regulator with XRE-family HTH domain
MPKPAYRGFNPARLRRRREELGWTQETLASKIGVYPTMVGKWENRQHVPDVSTIARLAQALEVRPQDFRGAGVEATAELEDLRLWAGLSRHQTQQLTGISGRLLRWYEHGTREPTGEHLAALAGAYGEGVEEVAAAWSRSRARQMGN